MAADMNDTENLEGTRIGQVQIIEQIGRGGMASVYLAEQPSMGRTVAVKVLPSQFTHNPKFRQRFEREVRVIAALQHPHILPVYDYGEVNGRPYIVMAYMPGGTLGDRIKEGPMALDEITRLLDQMASGLDFAHREGIVHRDFKPVNVLLDKNANAYLADFGIAKLTEGTTNLTGSGVIGTPAYMSPEMYDGGEVTAAIDIYALGVTLYEMLTGQAPYHAETPLRVIVAHATAPIPDPREFRPDLPAQISQVTMKAMAKRPDHRFLTAQALSQGFQAALRGEFRDEVGPVQTDSFSTPGTIRTPPMSMPPVPAPPGEVPAESTPQADQHPARDANRSRISPVVIAAIVGVVLLSAVMCVVGLGLAFGPGLNLFGAAVTSTAPPTVMDREETPTDQDEVVVNPTRTPSSDVDAPQPTATIIPTEVPVGRVAYEQGFEGASEVILISADGGSFRQLTDNGIYDGEPAFSPDGSQIAFESAPSGSIDILIMTDAGRITRTVASSGEDERNPDWSPDGTTLVYERGGINDANIWTTSLTTGRTVQLSDSTWGDRAASFSPDGSQIVFMTSQRGSWEIALMDAGTGEVTTIFDCPDADCRYPAWSPDGSRIVYNTLNASGGIGTLYIVEVATGQSTAVGGVGSPAGRPVWAADGERIFYNFQEDTNFFNLYVVSLVNGFTRQLTDGTLSSGVPDWAP
ncbi:MAG: protein kinase [Chloroflexi bacterium]|nr:protein kinase [Chloroflexota bacterium]